jgi:hypothetical protein
VKKKHKSKPQACDKKRDRPTLLEFLAGVGYEANKQFGVPLEFNASVRPAPIPGWGKRTISRLGKTILRPILKLRPSQKTTFQDFGKIIGVIQRGITFFRKDINEIIQEKFDGLDFSQISQEQWEEIQPSDQMLAFFRERLGRPIVETETWEDLEEEMFERRIKELEELCVKAFRFMAQQNVKENAKFLKGLQQGYEIFLDEERQFCGDRGRTAIYLELLSSMHEIEKMRRMIPPRKDADLYKHLKPWFRFPGANDEEKMHWFRKVCDDISLYMTGKRGRPSGSQTAPAY